MTTSTVVAIVADNSVTERSFFIRMGNGFFGCARSRYNLAVKDVINSQGPLIDRVKWIMHKLCYQICRAKLHQHAERTSVRCNETRWFSVQEMLNRNRQETATIVEDQ